MNWVCGREFGRGFGWKQKNDYRYQQIYGEDREQGMDIAGCIGIGELWVSIERVVNTAIEGDSTYES